MFSILGEKCWNPNFYWQKFSPSVNKCLDRRIELRLLPNLGRRNEDDPDDLFDRPRRISVNFIVAALSCQAY